MLAVLLMLHSKTAYIHTKKYNDMIYCKNFNDNERYYKYFIRTYYTINDCLALMTHLRENNNLLHFALIEHNKEETTHVHMLLTFKQAISPQNIYKKLNLISNLDNQNTEFELPNDFGACFEYLTHKNNIDKYQYEEERIYSDNIVFFKNSAKQNQYKSNQEFIDDLLTLDYLSMALKYGRDYIRNFTSYNNFKGIILAKSIED